MTDSQAQSTIYHWSGVTAVFGAVCNLLCWFLSIYQSYYLMHERIIWGYSIVIFDCISLAPLLVLSILPRSAPVAFLYGLALFSILIGRVDQLIQYHKFGAAGIASKFDSSTVLLLLLGGISIALFLIWAAIRLVAIVRIAPESDRSAS